MNFLYKTGGNPGFISPSGISIISPSVSIKTIIILMFWSNLINPLNNCCSWSTSGNFLHLWWWHVVSKTWLVQPRRSPHTSMITPGFTWTFPYLTTVPLHILVCFCGWDGIRMFRSRYIYTSTKSCPRMPHKEVENLIKSICQQGDLSKYCKKEWFTHQISI